jgi:tRNA(fMet)-specific endonuclease VapC
MTGNKFLLDTNIIVAWLNGDVTIANKVDKAEAVYIPLIVAGELFYGAMYSAQVQRNTNKIKQFIARYNTLPLNNETAEEYGRIKVKLRKVGRPIPENDIWIAALAIQHALPIVTKDRHFNEVENLSVKSW